MRLHLSSNDLVMSPATFRADYEVVVKATHMVLVSIIFAMLVCFRLVALHCNYRNIGSPTGGEAQRQTDAGKAAGIPAFHMALLYRLA